MQPQQPAAECLKDSLYLSLYHWWWFLAATPTPSFPTTSVTPCSSLQSQSTSRDTIISSELWWERNVVSILKKSQQRMYFLRQLKIYNLLQALMIQFYTVITESILTSLITIWFESSTSLESSLTCSQYSGANHRL